ncbi:hypothetical protein G9U51_12420 [Calidifontibacter sp. DB0510]|uniref:Phosphotyrosine protein phosphatase I domain-containing protein n=1 Tax=Metallococcus carri TaxID=1656884 RepID=A0A967EB52_9MICO|nr:hypothetical protein [Metallococcus carri]NHN56584.1 hypothetical protein [Metallococcus carri]NOP38883.1 hypothetical protein [Calidifontibacter sp. DB2511S]
MATTGTILIVCSGNVCRSPYIDLLLQDALRGSGVQVASAGTTALVDRPMEEGSLVRLRDRHGIDGSGFRARQLTPAMIAAADLVLCATRDHRAEVVRIEPAGLRRTFALTDFSDLVREMAPGVPAPSFLDEPGMSEVALVVSGAARRRSLVHPRSEESADIPDPFRRGDAAFERMADEIDAVIGPVIRALRS